jgi:hypothetical protein
LANIGIASFQQIGGKSAVIGIFWFKGSGSACRAEGLFLVSEITQRLGPAVMRGSIFSIDGKCSIECAQCFLHLAAVLLNPAGIARCAAGSHSGETEHGHRDVNPGTAWFVL